MLAWPRQAYLTATVCSFATWPPQRKRGSGHLLRAVPIHQASSVPTHARVAELLTADACSFRVAVGETRCHIYKVELENLSSIKRWTARCFVASSVPALVSLTTTTEQVPVSSFPSAKLFKLLMLGFDLDSSRQILYLAATLALD